MVVKSALRYFQHLRHPLHGRENGRSVHSMRDFELAGEVPSASSTATPHGDVESLLRRLGDSRGP